MWRDLNGGSSQCCMSRERSIWDVDESQKSQQPLVLLAFEDHRRGALSCDNVNTAKVCTRHVRLLLQNANLQASRSSHLARPRNTDHAFPSRASCVVLKVSSGIERKNVANSASHASIEESIDAVECWPLHDIVTPWMGKRSCVTTRNAPSSVEYFPRSLMRRRAMLNDRG